MGNLNLIRILRPVWFEAGSAKRFSPWWWVFLKMVTWSWYAWHSLSISSRGRCTQSQRKKCATTGKAMKFSLWNEMYKKDEIGHTHTHTHTEKAISDTYLKKISCSEKWTSHVFLWWHSICWKAEGTRRRTRSLKSYYIIIKERIREFPGHFFLILKYAMFKHSWLLKGMRDDTLVGFMHITKTQL